MAKRSWNQAICEVCWIQRESEYDDKGVLVSVRAPVRATDLSVEQCAYCGLPTISGFFVRDDPKTVAYPRYEDD